MHHKYQITCLSYGRKNVRLGWKWDAGMCLIFGFLTNLFTELTVHACSYSMFTGYEATCVPIPIPNQCCDIISHFDHIATWIWSCQENEKQPAPCWCTYVASTMQKSAHGQSTLQSLPKRGVGTRVWVFLHFKQCMHQKQTNKQTNKKKQVGCFNHRMIILVAIMLKSMSGLFGIWD